MLRQQPPPISIGMFDPKGNMNPVWVRWFQDVGKGLDKFRQTPDAVHTTNETLTSKDYGKIILFNIGASNATCILPTIKTSDNYCVIGPIYRYGTGRLTISADSLSRIEYSSIGGSIWCDEPQRAAANVTLQIIGSTQWAIIGGTGLWVSD
jgi:hypothetical protein